MTDPYALTPTPEPDALKNAFVNKDQEERIRKINYKNMPSTKLSAEQRREKENEQKRLRAKAKTSLMKGDLGDFVEMIEDAYERGVIGEKAYNNYQVLQQKVIETENQKLDKKETKEQINKMFENQADIEKDELKKMFEEGNIRRQKQMTMLKNPPEMQKEFKEKEFKEQRDPRRFKIVKEYKDDKEKKIQDEIQLDELATGLSNSILKQAQRQVRLEETGSVGKKKLEIVEEYSDDPYQVNITPEIQKKIREAIKYRNKMERRDAIRKRIMSEKEQLLRRENEIIMGKDKAPKIKEGRSDLSKFFNAYDKSAKDKIPFDGKIANRIKVMGREIMAAGEPFPEITSDSLEEIWNNFMTSEQQQNFIQPRSEQEVYEIVDIIDKFNRTAMLVPNDIEGNENMSKEDRQRLFHHLLFKSGKSKREVEREAQNNFENYDKMSGGVNAGLQTKTQKQENDDKADIPAIYQDYNQILDAKISDNAMSRELYKGIDPNDLIDAGLEPELLNEYFERLNALQNAQNNAEINGALNNIEILSGGNRDSLFGVQDQANTRTTLRGEYNPDYPDNLQYNPSGLERGRNAQAIDEVKEEELRLQDRQETGRTIGLSVGILGNSLRGVFGRGDVVDTRGKDSILDDINQNIRLLGKRTMYGTDKKQFDEDFEGTTSMDKRMASFAEYSNRRPYGDKNPAMMEQEAKQDEMDDITRAMMFSRGAGGAVGSTIPQLREQEFGYRQANRRVAHDGYAFVRGGNRTAAMIENEFLP